MALLRPNPFLPAPLSGVRQIEVPNEKGRLRWETDVTAMPTIVGSGSSDPRLEPRRYVRSSSPPFPLVGR